MAKSQTAVRMKSAPELPPKAVEPVEEQIQDKQKAKPKKVLPTKRIAVAKQLDILRSCVHASGQEGKAVRLDEMAALVKMHPNTVTLANPFLVDIGLITKGGSGFIPTADSIAYAGAYEWNPDTAAHKLAPTIAQAWFSKTLIPRLSMGIMGDHEAIEVLAAEAGAGPEYGPQLRMLLEFMEYAGLIQRENGRIAKRGSASPETGRMATEKLPSGESEGSVSPPSRSAPPLWPTQPTEGSIRFNVTVKVDMTEFAGWRADRIAAFFSGIAQVLAAKGALEQESTEA